MNEENLTPQEKKAKKLAGCAMIIYGGLIVAGLIWVFSILVG